VGKKKHPEHVNHERWLVSYADFITLLFAFFVVLFASSQSDKKKQSQLAAAMQTAFTPLGTFDAHAVTPPLDPSVGSPSTATPAPIQPPLPTAEQLEAQLAAQRFAQTEAHIKDLLEKRLPSDAKAPEDKLAEARLGKLKDKTNQPNSTGQLPPGSVTIRTTQEGLVISLHEAGFFSSGSAEVRPVSLELLNQLAATLTLSPLRVEGHTDNIPIHTAQFHSNWELSTARATAIARLLLDRGNINPANLAAAGYAEFHPIASNDTEEGRAQNRRVDIILLRPPSPSR
jgi:chemotaxis protein MotB